MSSVYTGGPEKSKPQSFVNILANY